MIPFNPVGEFGKQFEGISIPMEVLKKEIQTKIIETDGKIYNYN